MQTKFDLEYSHGLETNTGRRALTVFHSVKIIWLTVSSWHIRVRFRDWYTLKMKVFFRELKSQRCWFVWKKKSNMRYFRTRINFHSVFSKWLTIKQYLRHSNHDLSSQILYVGWWPWWSTWRNCGCWMRRSRVRILVEPMCYWCGCRPRYYYSIYFWVVNFTYY